MLATAMDGGSAENAGAFFGLRPRFVEVSGRSKQRPYIYRLIGKSKFSRLKILDRLVNLGLRIHHKRPVTRHRFV